MVLGACYLDEKESMHYNMVQGKDIWFKHLKSVVL
jgi:hypothetical protein